MADKSQPDERNNEDLGIEYASQNLHASASCPPDEHCESTKEVVQQDMFFSKLNHDVRMMIYDYLYEHLPPLVRKGVKNDKPGMILSCRQANLELSQAAARHLKLYLEDFCGQFQKKYSLPIQCSPIPLYEGWANLKSVTLSLDIVPLLANYNPDKEGTWDRADQAFDGNPYSKGILWRQLLYHPFHKVTLLVTNGASDTATSPPDLDKLQTFLGGNLSSLGETIGHDFHHYQVACDILLLDPESEYVAPPKRCISFQPTNSVSRAYSTIVSCTKAAAN